MEIKNVKVYGLEESIIRSGYPMQIEAPTELGYTDDKCIYIGEAEEKDYIRSRKLANTPNGSGHDNFLKGIIVQFDLKYTQYWTKHLQRYTWFTYFSGQSQMHKMTTRSLKDACNKYVIPRIINEVQLMIDTYNYADAKYPLNIGGIEIINKQKLFQAIMSNCPMGYELWQPVSTNYMSLKTMYNQRRHHKLEEWQEFCDWIETLPMSKLITNKKDEQNN